MKLMPKEGVGNVDEGLATGHEEVHLCKGSGKLSLRTCWMTLVTNVQTDDRVFF